MGSLWSALGSVDGATIYKMHDKDRGTVMTEEVIVNNDSEVLMPLSLYEQLGPYEVTSNQYKNKYFIRMPVGSIKKNKIVFDRYGLGEVIQAPIYMIEDKPYVNVTNHPYLGMTATMEKENVILMQSKENLSLPKKQAIEGRIALTFDPLVEGPKYSQSFVQMGTSIVSPSLFELTEDGLKVSSKLSAAYVQEYQKNGYQIWPLVSNQFSPSLTHKILGREHMWNHYSQQLVNYALAYNFSGYNFDFEDIDYGDREKLSQFVAFLSERLRPYGIYTSIDVTGYSNSENWSLVYDRSAYGKVVDYVVLMAYDETWAKSTVAGPVASYPWVRSNLVKLLDEVPKEKVILGIPFYMRSWTIPVEGKWEGKAKGKTLPMEEADKLQMQFKEGLTWNDTLRLHYVELEDHKGNLQLREFYAGKESKPFKGNVVKIWFEDLDSLREKIDLVKEFSLAGVGAWRKGFEGYSTWIHLGSMLESDHKKGRTIKTDYKAEQINSSEDEHSLSAKEERALRKEQERAFKKEQERLKQEQARIRKEEKRRKAEERLRKEELQKKEEKQKKEDKRLYKDEDTL